MLNEIVSAIAGAGTRKVLDEAARKPRKRGRKRRSISKKGLSKNFEENFRRRLFAALEELINPAIAQAKAGKPALLRLLTRATSRSKAPVESQAEKPVKIIFDTPRPERSRPTS